jgi:hypothetical protein
MGLVETVGLWHGTASLLLSDLETRIDDRTKKRPEWPKTARKLSGELRRLAPNLRKTGIEVTFGKHTKKGIPITLEHTGKTSSPPSPPKYSTGKESEHGDESDGLLHPQSNSLYPDNEAVEWTA